VDLIFAAVDVGGDCRRQLHVASPVGSVLRSAGRVPREGVASAADPWRDELPGGSRM